MKELYPDILLAAFVIECFRGRGRIWGSFPEVSQCACSYRGELVGLMAMHLILLSINNRGSTRSFFSLSHESQKKHNSELPRHPLFFPLFSRSNTHLFKLPIPHQSSTDPPRPLALYTPFPCMGICIISSLAYAASPRGYANVGRFVSFAPLAAQHCAKKNGTMIFFPFPPINRPPTHSVL